jgi:acyl carrier protein
MIVKELGNIAPEIEHDEIPFDDDLRDALDLDSMDFLRLISAVSKQTGLNIPEADYGKVLSVDEMVDYLNNLG